MGTNDVHVPRVPHPRFAGKSGLGTRGDVILQLDWTIGEVMRTLDSLGIADNTLLVFTSDNGPAIDDGYQDEAAMRLGIRPQASTAAASTAFTKPERAFLSSCGGPLV